MFYRKLTLRTTGSSHFICHRERTLKSTSRPPCSSWPHLGSLQKETLGEPCARLQCDGPPHGYRRSALRSWCKMHVRVDQGWNPEHVCSTKGRNISGGHDINSSSTYVPCHFRIAFLFINSPGVLRGRLNRTGHLTRYSLIRAKSFGTNRGIDGLEVVEKAFRDSLFGCRG